MEKHIIIESVFGQEKRKKTQTCRYNPITNFLKNYFNADCIDLDGNENTKVDQICQLYGQGYTPIFLFGHHTGTFYSLSALKKYNPELKIAVDSFDTHLDTNFRENPKVEVNCANWASKSLPFMEKFACVGFYSHPTKKYVPRTMNQYLRFLKEFGISNDFVIKILHNQIGICEFTKLPSINPKYINDCIREICGYIIDGHPIFKHDGHLIISREEFREMSMKEIANLILKNTGSFQHYLTFDIDSLDGYDDKPDRLTVKEVTDLLSRLTENGNKPISLDFATLENLKKNNEKMLLKHVVSIIHTLYD